MLKSKHFFFFTFLALCLSLGGVRAEFGKSLRYGKAPNGEDIICVYKFGMIQNCYPRVFQATSEYQTILEGQEIPKGLDIQISMRTGERRAKLSDAAIQQQKLQQQYQEYLEQQQQIQRQQAKQAQQQRQYQEYQDYLQQLQAQQQQQRSYRQQQPFTPFYDAQSLPREYQQRKYQEYLQQRQAQQQYREYQDYLQKKQAQEYQQRAQRAQQLKQAQERQYQEYLQQLQAEEEARQAQYEQYYQQQQQQQQEQQEQYEQYYQQQQQQQEQQQEEQESSEPPHEIVMVKETETEDEKVEEDHKVQFHSGKYKSSESPYVESPESNEDEEDSDEDDDVVRIHYQDKVSYNDAFDSLNEAKTLEEKIEMLEQLEEIVHHIEFGQELMKSLPDFLKFVRDENPQIRALASICIGSALQNNPKARKAAIKQNLYDILVERLTQESNTTVLKRLVYAFSNLVRGDKNMIKKLFESKTLSLLYHLYINQPALRSKLEIFITDIFDPAKIKEGTSFEEIIDTEGTQLWCSLFQNNLLTKEAEDLPEAINALSILLDAGQCAMIQPDIRLALQDLPQTQPQLFEGGLDELLNQDLQKILNYQGPRPSTQSSLPSPNPSAASQKPFDEL